MCRKNKKGYTLAELLIVVAIIGILVAVSIPIFASQLRKAKVAVDQANARAGKAAIVAYILTYPETYIDGNTHTLCYDASTGKVVATAADVAKLTAYGKTSDVRGSDNVDGLLDTDGTYSNLTSCIVTGTFYVDGSTINKKTDFGDETVVIGDEKDGSATANPDEDTSASKAVGDQIKIQWMSPEEAVKKMGN